MTMAPKYRWIKIAVGALVLLFGLLCLNYTKAEGWEHHSEQALRYGFPPPSTTIFNLGVIATVVGAGLAGFGIGSRRKRRRDEHSVSDAASPRP
jgi:hypothetical protein